MEGLDDRCQSDLRIVDLLAVDLRDDVRARFAKRIPYWADLLLVLERLADQLGLVVAEVTVL